MCAWNPTDQLLASGSGDSSARIWNLNSGNGQSSVVLLLDHRLGSSVPQEDGGAASKDITTLDWNVSQTIVSDNHLHS